MRELWTELGALSVAGASGSASRVERLIDARSRQADGSVVPTRARPVPRVALFAIALAASVLVGVMIGRGSGAAPAAPATQAGPVATPNPAKEKYVLLLHGPARARGTAVQAAADSANERALVAEYAAWAGRLAGEGSLIAGEKLADDPLTMLVANGTVDVPRYTADELGGFFIIQVADSAEAYRIARDCPHLKHGGTVQVRRIDPT